MDWICKKKTQQQLNYEQYFLILKQFQRKNVEASIYFWVTFLLNIT